MARPIKRGSRGAVSAGHPAAVAAGLAMLDAGGNAFDAMIAAQAVLCVVLPASCGLGGDLLALVRTPEGEVHAINGTGAAPADPGFLERAGPGASVTVPGLVDAWCQTADRWGRLGLGRCLEPAIELAAGGTLFGQNTARAVRDQSARLSAGGADGWVVIETARAGTLAVQPELASLLRVIVADGRDAFYSGAMAEAIAAAVKRTGGSLAASDLAEHRNVVREPITIDWQNGQVHVQPPMTQGVLLAMCLKRIERDLGAPPDALDHIAVEITKASFEYRDRAAEGARLLDIALDIDPERAVERKGPRAYLHTTGIATADAAGMVCSSLISVFDEFGSCVFVPEGGFTLNNRGDGFTGGANAAAPAKRPVHTLAPMMWARGDTVMALATPGADGQVQTLLQIMVKAIAQGRDLADAIAAPRWRSENGKLLVPGEHPARALLEARGHAVEDRDNSDSCFGGVVCAGVDDDGPFAGSDWRREVWHDGA